MEFIVTDQPSDEDILQIRQGLRSYNAPFLEGIEDQELACFVQNESGRKIGGIVGRAWGSWLCIKFLWVDEQHNNQGIGSGLLARLEQQAIEKGCRYALVDTLDFQAKPFYEKQGYRCRMTLDEYPALGQLHFLVKELTKS